MIKYNFVIIVGIRPQYVKLAALLAAINQFNNDNKREIINAITIDIAQHYDECLACKLHDEFNLQFNYQLKHLKLNPIDILANSIVGVNDIFLSIMEPIHWVIVFGDGTPALVGALVAARNRIPVAHIEAGVNRSLSEPEGVNRKVTDSLSSAFFCVTNDGVDKLQSEGITNNVYWVGDIGVDFFLEYSAALPAGYGTYEVGEYVLASIHRQGNIEDETLSNILIALNRHNRPAVFISHPRIKSRLKDLGLLQLPGVEVVDSMAHWEVISAMKGCAFLVTDSGGLIREAYHLRKRCLVRRTQAGWPLLIEAGINRRITKEIVDIEKGLKWAESVLTKYVEPVNGIVREQASQFVLNTLINLSR